MRHLYTDINAECCAWLGARVEDGSLPPGDVVIADIRDIRAEDLDAYDAAHLFAGIGGFPLALAWAQWPSWLRVLTGGFPCQDISVAGKGTGLSGKRSGLFWEIQRVARPGRFDVCIIENVGALSRRGLDAVAAAMGEAGYVVRDAYRVGAWAFGCPHERERWWIVCWGRAIADGTCDQRCGRVVSEQSGRPRQATRDASRFGDGHGHSSKEPDAGEDGRLAGCAVEGDEGCAGVGRGQPAAEHQHGAAGEVIDPGAHGRGAVGQCGAGSESDQSGEDGAAVAEPDAAVNAAQRTGLAGWRSQGRAAAWGAGAVAGWQPPIAGPWRRDKDEWLYAGAPALVYTSNAGCGECDAAAESSDEGFTPARPDPTVEAGGPGLLFSDDGRWFCHRSWVVPVRPEFRQHEWEPARIYQRGVGDAVHGVSGRMAASLNRSGVMALGNAIVPQVAAAVARGILRAVEEVVS